MKKNKDKIRDAIVSCTVKIDYERVYNCSVNTEEITTDVSPDLILSEIIQEDSEILDRLAEL